MSTDVKPLVSICSITYNHAPYIRQCLEGFLMQQCDFDYEIIINDDCSADGTTEIIREYASKYPKIIKPIYHDENEYSKGVRGMFATYVFPKAQGKYIALCEGDDYWTDPLKLQKQVDFLEAHPGYSMCFHNAMERWVAGDHCDKIFSNIEDKDYSGLNMYQRWIVPTASVIIIKSVLESDIYREAIFHKEFCFGDILLFLSAASIGRVRGMSALMSVYNRHQGGAVYSLDANKIKKMCKHNACIPIVFGEQYKQVSQTHIFVLCWQELKDAAKALNILRVLVFLIISLKYTGWRVLFHIFKAPVRLIYSGKK